MVELDFKDDGLSKQERSWPANLIDQFKKDVHASREYLAALTPDESRRVELLVGGALVASIQSSGQPAVTITRQGDKICVGGAMQDCSFIADTVELAIQKSGIERPEHGTAEYAFPDGPRMGLFYVEFTGDDNLAKDFSSKLDAALSVLKVTADDFARDKGVEANKYFQAVDALSAKILDERAGYAGSRYQPEEIAEFTEWLKTHFIFMGHTRMEVGAQGEITPSTEPSSGMFRMDPSISDRLIRDAQLDARTSIEKNQPVWISRLGVESQVQRDDRLINLTFQERREDGSVAAVHSVVGLFSHDGQKAITHEIPLIRTKHEALAARIPDNERAQKYLERLIDGMPVELALRLGVGAIKSFYDAASNAHGSNPVHVHLSPDSSNRGVAALVVLPTDRCSPETLGALKDHFEKACGAEEGTGRYHVDLSQPRYARAYVWVPTDGRPIQMQDADLLAEVVKLVRSKGEHLEQGIRGLPSSTFSDERVEDVAARYKKAFPKAVIENEPTELLLKDVQRIEGMRGQDTVRVSLDQRSEGADVSSTISIYSKQGKLNVSKIVPILEKAGFTVDEDQFFRVNPTGADPVFAARITVTPKPGVKLNADTFADFVGPGLEEVIKGKAENDTLNSLMANAGLSTQQIGVLRAVGMAVSRFGVASEARVQQALAANPKIASLAYDMIHTKFSWDVHKFNEDRESLLAPMKAAFNAELRGVKAPPDAHKILSSLGKVLNATKRAVIDGDTTVLKTFPQEMDFLTGEQPLVATFIASPRVRCAHLRHGLVARGGFRWSDKPDEFYVEVKKLASTQRKKNGPLVVDGAKGAFVPGTGVSGEEAYRECARALLSITDNRVGGKVISPANLVRWDGDDPYLVMAADKGTGNFSYIANEEAVKADFWGPGNKGYWLGHVFASGGPHGFSHFATGVTARGALIVSNFQLLAAGIDPKAPQDVLLIGDPYGDVSGNAITRRENWNIVAAWGYPNILIDPNPSNPEAHLAERQRLLAAGAKEGAKAGIWERYDQKLLSEGGGIYRVDDPAIPVTPQARARFNIPDDKETLTGDEYIQFLQRAKIGLRYGGGIGTHVKASTQEAGATQDTPNEGKLVNGSEVGCKVAIEGGNNGWTQQARLEAARNGVRMFVDAIDNVGGVKTSNEEVLWGLTVMEKVLRTQDFDETAYHELMAGLQDDALENVFRLVHDQCTTLILDEAESKGSLPYFELMLSRLEQDGILARGENHLPSPSELSSRVASSSPGLLGPELAECLSGAKRWVKDVLLREGNPTLADKAVDPLFVESFPERLLETGADGIVHFPLRPQQTATQLSNALVDSLGTTFLFHIAAKNAPTQPEKAIHAATVAEVILDVRHLRDQVREQVWGGLEDSPSRENYDTYIEAMRDVRTAHQSLTSWVLSNHARPQDIESIKKLYVDMWAEAAQNPLAIVPDEHMEEVQGKIARYTEAGMDRTLANKLALSGSIGAIFEMEHNVARDDEGIVAVATRYWPVVRAIGVTRVHDLTGALNTKEPHRDNAMGDDLRFIRRATAQIANALKGQSTTDVVTTIAEKPEFANLQSAIQRFAEMVQVARHDDKLVADALLILHTVRERVEDLGKALAPKK